MLKERQKRTTNTQEKAGGPIQAYSYPLKATETDVILAYHICFCCHSLYANQGLKI